MQLGNLEKKDENQESASKHKIWRQKTQDPDHESTQ